MKYVTTAILLALMLSGCSTLNGFAAPKVVINQQTDHDCVIAKLQAAGLAKNFSMVVRKDLYQIEVSNGAVDVWPTYTWVFISPDAVRSQVVTMVKECKK